MSDKVGDERQTWVSEGRSDLWRWRHKVLGQARRRFDEAGLLTAMERETDVADFAHTENNGFRVVCSSHINLLPSG